MYLYVSDPVTGVHTQTVENTWCHLKRSLPETGTQRENLWRYLAQYMYWTIRDQDQDRFRTFLQDVAVLYPGAP